MGKQNRVFTIFIQRFSCFLESKWFTHSSHDTRLSTLPSLFALSPQHCHHEWNSPLFATYTLFPGFGQWWDAAFAWSEEGESWSFETSHVCVVCSFNFVLLLPFVYKWVLIDVLCTRSLPSACSHLCDFHSANLNKSIPVNLTPIFLGDSTQIQELFVHLQRRGEGNNMAPVLVVKLPTSYQTSHSSFLL